MKLKLNWDALGITATLACAIHCALLPLLLSSLPLFGINIIDNIFFETGMIVLAFLIGGYSLLHGYLKHHHRFFPVLLFTAGIVFLVLKQYYHSLQYWFLAPAVILIVSAHYYNWRSCRVANHCHSSDCNH
ncbi:MAG: MerC family mercury resistance protein [Terrimonas sp.]|nr:MerC family mercury resistance protein [Terrimonas sp.]